MNTRLLRYVCVLLLALCACSTLAWAQRTITGKVTDDDSKRLLAGVKILVKGGNTGTLTNKDGSYSINAGSATALIFSYIGMKKQEVSIGDKTTVDVVMKVDSKLLDDVVVTALGVERERRAVNYAVQDIKADEISQSSQQNMVNALQGRIAGVQITNAGGAPGAGSSIIIRGGNSVDSDNQPLFVIDGIPMDNNTTAETAGGNSSLNAQLARSVSNSNRAMDINPDDIESMSVLKGPAAAALYGLRAANGVVIITTKRGFKEKLEVTYSNSFSWDVANKLPETQSIYKQGTGGFYDVTTRNSYGPRFQPGEAIYDNMGNFFGTGFAQQHNINVSGASDRLNYFFSGSSFNQKGIIPGTDWTRLSFRFNGGAAVSSSFKINTSLNYTNSGGTKVLQGAGLYTGDFAGTGGYLWSTVYWPKNDDMRNWQNSDGTRRRFLTNSATTDDADNPYFAINKCPITDNVDRIIGNVSMVYDPFEWLNVTYRAGGDFTNERSLSVRAYGSSLPNSQKGSISESKNNRANLSSNLLLTFKPYISEDIKADFLVANSVETEYFNATDYFGRNFINPDFVSINNTDPLENRVVERITQRRLFSFYGSANLNWKDKVYIGLNARNDWSSTLPVANRSFFYYSTTLGYVFNEDLGFDFLSYGKLRGSYARVGKDASPYRTGTALTSNVYLGGGFRNDFWAGNDQLKPETTEGIEAGVELKFLDNRIGLDVTVYRQRTIDQLIAPRISQGSGFIFAYLNGGTVENKGVEILLTATPVRTADFSWFLGVNFTANTSKVVELPSVLTELNQSDASVTNVARGSAFPGYPLQAISVNDYQRSTDGKNSILIDGTTGYPLSINGATWKYAGNRQPDAMIGITNSFTLDNITFSFLWDIRIGGKVVNGTEWEMVRAGMSTKTLDRYKTAVLTGVVRTISGTDTTYTPNTKSVELTENYYRLFYGGAGANFVEDGSWVRLRTVNLSYRFPKTLFEGTPISGAEITLTGRNLLLFTKYSGMDPEVSAAGAGVKGAGSNGMDYLGIPSTKGFTVGLRLTL